MKESRMTRRKFLGLLGGATAATVLAGCDIPYLPGRGTPTPDGNPAQVPTPEATGTPTAVTVFDAETSGRGGSVELRPTPEPTFTPTPTATIEPTPTATPEPTQTATAMPEPTPTVDAKVLAEQHEAARQAELESALPIIKEAANNRTLFMFIPNRDDVIVSHTNDWGKGKGFLEPMFRYNPLDYDNTWSVADNVIGDKMPLYSIDKYNSLHQLQYIYDPKNPSVVLGDHRFLYTYIHNLEIGKLGYGTENQAFEAANGHVNGAEILSLSVGNLPVGMEIYMVDVNTGTTMKFTVNHKDNSIPLTEDSFYHVLREKGETELVISNCADTYYNSKAPRQAVFAQFQTSQGNEKVLEYVKQIIAERK